MSANSALIAFTDSNPKDVLRAYPVLDKPATKDLAERLFPGAQIAEIGDELLVDALNPPEDIAYLGCFGALDLVCSWKIMPDRPSQLDPAVLGATVRRNTYLYALHADADWCSFGLWQDGELVRAYSACPDPGVIEDIGARLSFEQTYETYDELGDAVLEAFFGIDQSNDAENDDVDPEMIPVVGYRVSPHQGGARAAGAGSGGRQDQGGARAAGAGWQDQPSADEERPQVALGDRQ